MQTIRTSKSRITPSASMPTMQDRNYKLPSMTIIILGLAALILPNISDILSPVMKNVPKIEIVSIIGWLSLLTGIAYATHAFQTRKYQKPLPKVLQATLYFFVGAYLLLSVSTGPLPFVFLLTMFFLLDSIMKFMLSSQYRFAKGTKWAINTGIVNVILSLFVATGYPSGAAWAIGLYLGINLFLTGMMCKSYSSTIVPLFEKRTKVFRPSTTATETT